MSDSLNQISQAEIREKLATIRRQTQPVSAIVSKPEPALNSPFLLAAAVIAFYDPETIRPITWKSDGEINPEDRIRQINELIGCSDLLTANTDSQPEPTDKKAAAHTIHFSLRDEYRKIILKQLAIEGLIKQALASNQEITFSRTNALQFLLTSCLHNEKIELGDLNMDQLSAYCRVVGWMSHIPNNGIAHTSDEILKRMDMVEMLTPFKHLTGNYTDGVFVSTFRGRKSELSMLRSYVGVAEPHGALETIGRIINSVTSPLFSAEKKPLLVFGIGGVGKSTLLAEFILEHMEALRKDRFPFVYLDFDRPHLSPLQPETLLIEAARQLSIQYKHLENLSAELQSFHARWNKAYSVLIDAGNTTTIDLASTATSQQTAENNKAIRSEFLQLVNKLASYESKPFLIILDTFEEVQYKGVAYIRQLYEFMQQLQEQFAALRVVIAGRAPISEFMTIQVELGNLDPEAAEGYLLKSGITDAALAKSVSKLIGGNPLTLKLAADVVKKYGLQELQQVGTTKKSFGIFNTRLPEIEIQGMLYLRILDHLHNPELEKLAHPGMVLRRITSEIILKVLAEPCELNVTNAAEAEQLFRQMSKEIALVSTVDTGILRHRPDVRRIMLRLIKQSEKKHLVDIIHRRAIEYYRDKEGIANRAEEFYHRLAIGESPRVLDKNWLEGMQNYLLGSLEELPDRAQAFLLAKTGVETSNISVWENADMEDINRHIARQAANLLNSGQAKAVLELLDQVTYGKGSEILSVLKTRAYSQLGQLEEAVETAKSAMSSFFADQFSHSVVAELQRVISGSGTDEKTKRPGTGGSHDPNAEMSSFDV